MKLMDDCSGLWQTARLIVSVIIKLRAIAAESQIKFKPRRVDAQFQTRDEFLHSEH